MKANLEYYKTFYWVAKTGSVSQAAGKLFISQPAVSQSLKLLEQTLGCSLFFRNSKGVRLTPEGEKLFLYVREGIERIDEGEKTLMEMLTLDSGEIRIGASDMTLRFFLLDHLENFRNKHLKVKLTVSNAPTPETLCALKNGKIDFGVVSSPFEIPDTMHVFKVGKVEDIFVASTRFSQNKIVSLSELAGYPLICLEKNTSSTRQSLDAFFENSRTTISPEIELATSDLIVKFAERSLGIGAVAECFARDAINSERLFKLKLEKPIPPRDICVVTRDKAWISTAAKAFVNEILSRACE